MDTTMKCGYCDPATSAEVWVALGEDIMSTYKARILTNRRWNGFAIPAFDYKEALRVAADTHLLGAEHNDKGDSVEFASYDASRDAFIMTGGGRSEDDEALIITATTCCGRYDIGAMNWTWVEDEEPEIGDLPQFTKAHLTEL
jgi:hypothetical protein